MKSVTDLIIPGHEDSIVAIAMATEVQFAGFRKFSLTPGSQMNYVGQDDRQKRFIDAYNTVVSLGIQLKSIALAMNSNLDSLREERPEVLTHQIGKRIQLIKENYPIAVQEFRARGMADTGLYLN